LMPRLARATQLVAEEATVERKYWVVTPDKVTPGATTLRPLLGPDTTAFAPVAEHPAIARGKVISGQIVFDDFVRIPSGLYLPLAGLREIDPSKLRSKRAAAASGDKGGAAAACAAAVAASCAAFRDSNSWDPIVRVEETAFTVDSIGDMDSVHLMHFDGEDAQVPRTCALYTHGGDAGSGKDGLARHCDLGYSTGVPPSEHECRWLSVRDTAFVSTPSARTAQAFVPVTYSYLVTKNPAAVEKFSAEQIEIEFRRQKRRGVRDASKVAAAYRLRGDDVTHFLQACEAARCRDVMYWDDFVAVYSHLKKRAPPADLRNLFPGDGESAAQTNDIVEALTHTEGAVANIEARARQKVDEDDEQSDQAERMEGDEQEFDGDRDDPYLQLDPEGDDIDQELRAFDREEKKAEEKKAGENERLRRLLDGDSEEKKAEGAAEEEEEAEATAGGSPSPAGEGAVKDTATEAATPPAKRKGRGAAADGGADTSPPPAKRKPAGKPAGKAAAKAVSALVPDAEKTRASVRQYCNSAPTLIEVCKKVVKEIDQKKAKAEAERLEAKKGIPRRDSMGQFFSRLKEMVRTELVELGFSIAEPSGKITRP